jgi:hypothetical protein
MIIKDNELKAEKGMKLTNGHTFGDTVRLSELDSADNWHEITDEEAEALQELETE